MSDAAVLEAPETATPRYLPHTRITPKQQLFAELLATGIPHTQAAKQAGYTAKASATQALKNPAVQQYLSTIRNRAATRAAYSVVSAMDEAKDAMLFARETENATAYVKAVELRAKLSGLLIERVEVFTADLKGALDAAQSRVINIAASIQPTQALEQAEANIRENSPACDAS